MIVDTSALIAILLGERGSDRLAQALAAADAPTISAATLVESRIVVQAKLGPTGRRRLDALLREARISVAPVDEAQANAACDAYRDFGKGTGHPAGLNFGDCFSYALASLTGEPLLFTGEDFARTDLQPAASRPGDDAPGRP